MKALLILVTMLAASVTKARAGHGRWGYGGSRGPDNWPDTYPKCIGARQSPVALVTDAALQNTTWGPLQFTNYDSLPLSMTVTNTGHSVKVNAVNCAAVSGGNLPGRYVFAQFHFHWGAVATRGSEHTLDEEQFPAELHLVHYRERYGNVRGAVKHHKGVAVLSVLLKLFPHNNPTLEPIINSLTKIPNPGDWTPTAPFPLRTILPNKTEHFFRYDGSLTTPACNEAVIWTVFKEPIHISSDQLEAFRELVAADGRPLKDNFRSLQPLNGRKVYKT